MTHQLYLHDSKRGQRTTFVPIDPSRITLYVCGPTVYNYVHIGNGRPAVVFDVLVRLLRKLYPHVVYARNFTDIDDKINAAALEHQQDIGQWSERFIDAYAEDVARLGVLPPDLEPRATEHIAEIVVMIQDLIGKGHAYAADGHVLFNVPSDPQYGSLSHRELEDMIAGARVEVAPYKKHPADFVLWKPSSAELPGWDSPWGRGRPGWHIECSAMIAKHLGDHIDIHGGGSDLLFPHHENEQAQSSCVNGPPFVNYWLHNGMLNLGGEKMAKSVGNFFTIRQLLGKVDGEVLRYALLSGHYRSPLEWSDRLMEQAQSSLDRLYGALRDAPVNNLSTAADCADWQVADIPSGVRSALLDDLNTPAALAALHELAAELRHARSDAGNARRLRGELLAGGWLLGLFTRTAEAHFQGTGPGGAQADTLSDVAIDALLEDRRAARAAKDFKRADQIRDELKNAGIEVEDTAGGTRWKRIR